MGKKILIYFSDEEIKKLERLLTIEESKTGQRNVSEFLKRALFERRERRKQLPVLPADMIYRSQVRSKVSSIIGDYQAGRDIILALRKLEKMTAMEF